MCKKGDENYKGKIKYDNGTGVNYAFIKQGKYSSSLYYKPANMRCKLVLLDSFSMILKMHPKFCFN